MNYEDIRLNEYQRNKKLFFVKYLHVYLGLQQLYYRPYLNIFTICICVTYSVMWYYKDFVLKEFYILDLLIPFLQIIISVFLWVMFLLSVIGMLEEIGKIVAREDESGLAYTFVNSNMRMRCPILFSKKLLKGTNVTVREFYSEIPLHNWIDMKNDIEDNLDITLVEPYITYGGKNKDTSKRIIMYSLRGKKGRNQMELQDEEF